MLLIMYQMDDISWKSSDDDQDVEAKFKMMKMQGNMTFIRLLRKITGESDNDGDDLCTSKLTPDDEIIMKGYEEDVYSISDQMRKICEHDVRSECWQARTSDVDAKDEKDQGNVAEFWASAYVHNRSVRFKMNNKKHIIGLEQFRDILQICPKVGNKKFVDPPLEKEILIFLASLGHSGDIRKLTDVNVNKLHQPWRSFAAVINKCLSGTPSYDSLRLSQFDYRLKALEDNFSEFRQTNQYAKALSSIPSTVDQYLAHKMQEAKIIKEQVKKEVSKIIPKVEKFVTDQLESEVLVRSSKEANTSHAVAANLLELELKKILIDKMEANNSINGSDIQRQLYKVLVEAYEA
ncbi:hypothetical protein Tco_1381365, partial [Tanacetum coccineum]